MLFVVQPMVAKSLLPRFGGSAGVWIACMLFFQVVPLLGYFIRSALDISAAEPSSGAYRRAHPHVGALLLRPRLETAGGGPTVAT